MWELNQQGAIWILSGDQPINTESIAELDQQIQACFAGAPPKLVLNLQQVPLLDSAGLEWLWDVRHRCEVMGGAFEIAGPTPLCREILQATRLTHHFVVFDDVVTAAGSFAQ